jgi:hypothetical protein
MSCGLSDSLDSTIVVPELQLWANRFVMGSSVNKYEVPYPVYDLTHCYLPGSFISMLFDDTYCLDHYHYLYADKEDRLSWPWVVRQRLLIYPRSARYMTIDPVNGENLFLLQQDDFTMLDALLALRMATCDSTTCDSTALILIDDSTAPVSFDSTSGVIVASLATLNTELSKLIFLFLDLCINNNVDNYCSSDVPISTSHALQTLYELYVMDKYFEIVSARRTDITPYCPIREE